MTGQEKKNFPLLVAALAANVVIAGTGHILAGRVRKGMVIAFAYLLFLDGMFVVGSQIYLGGASKYIQSTSIALAAVVWFYGNVSYVRFAFFSDYDRVEARMSAQMSAGRERLFKGEFRAAREEFEEILMADVSRTVARLLAGLSREAAGDRVGARKAYSFARKLDSSGEWAFEIEEAVARLNSKDAQEKRQR